MSQGFLGGPEIKNLPAKKKKKKRIFLPMQGTQVISSGKTPHATGQLSLCITTTEPVL